MKIKHLIALFLCFAMLFGAMGALTSCGDNTGGNYNPDNGTTPPDDNEGGNNDAGVNYTVTLKDYKGNAIKDIKVVFISGDYTSSLATTDASGNATASVKVNGDVKVELIDLKSYGEPTEKKCTFDSGKTSLEITLNPNVVITVVDVDGNPIEGVEFQMCHGNTCLNKNCFTDNNGVATRTFAPKGKIKLSFKSVPDGYIIPDVVESVADTDYHVVLEDGVFEATVVLNTAN